MAWNDGKAKEAAYIERSRAGAVSLTDAGGNELLELTYADAGAKGARSVQSLLTAGGDHPYAQWWGTNGEDGLAAMFLDAGIRPYIAICADESPDQTSGYGATIGKPGMLTAAQAAALQARGVEFISHGARHIHFWELLNTGIRVYYTGAEATPTVNISATQLITSTATTGATNFVFTTYPTLAQLATAINALAGWNCILATELTGAEPSSSMLPLRAARSVVDPGAPDPTKSNQRFALVGGIMVRYTGTVYRDISISLNNGSNFFGIYADGARLAAISTAQTLTQIVTAINALNVVGLTALVMDNGFNAQSVGGSTVLNPGQKIRETYCYGDEDGTALARVNLTKSVNGTGQCFTGGLGFDYAMRRLVLAVKERAATLYGGLQIDSFAQAGGRFYPWMLRTVGDLHLNWRGNHAFRDLNAMLSPQAMPMAYGSKFAGHFTSTLGDYSEADVKAVGDALADSEGWQVNWLNHLVTPTPLDPSPYAGLNRQSAAVYASGADQDEGPFYRELTYIVGLAKQGKFEMLSPTAAELARAARRLPSNLIFNPRFRNGRNNNLLGITTAAQGSGGIAVPGWQLATAASDYSAVTVVDGQISLTTVGALGANKTPLAVNLFLEPGKTYEIGAALDMTSWGAANRANFILYPSNNALGYPFVQSLASIASETYYGGQSLEACFRLTIPQRTNAAPARAISVAGPFVFGGTDSITIKIDNRTASAAISLAGLTTARAVANAINTAIAADATYGPLGQYDRVARVEDNRVVIEAPAVSAVEDSSLLEILNSVGTPLAVLFGAGVTTVRSTSKLSSTLDSSMFSYRLALLLSTTAAVQTFRMQAPFCREVRMQ